MEFDERLYLASTSPRRLELMAQFGLKPQTVAAPVEEVALPNESATSFVTRIAIEKAFAGYNKLAGHDIWVVGGDTIVVLDEQILGKPRSLQQAESFLKQLSGKTHQVCSALAILHQGEVFAKLNITDVTFSDIDGDALRAYLSTGESIGKAGGYAIQGFAAQFIRAINGSYSSVMGLPLFELSELLIDSGYPMHKSLFNLNKSV